VETLEEAYRHYSKFTAKGLEGAVLKNIDGVWKDGTSRDCIKLKIEFEVDLEVVAIHEGEGKAMNMMGSITLKSSDGLIVTDCGSGFSDTDRMDWWLNSEERIGSIVTIKGNDIISKRENEVKSIFLPIYLEHRLDKTVADSYYRCYQQLEAAKNGGMK
jgi:DNA ligase-1